MADKVKLIIVICLVLVLIQESRCRKHKKCRTTTPGSEDDDPDFDGFEYDEDYVPKSDPPSETSSQTNTVIINVMNAHDDPLSLCGDWQQLGVKCYKFIDVLTNKSDAKEQCRGLDKSSSVVQIRSKQEQDDIMQFMKQYKHKSVPVHYEARNTKRTVHPNSSVVSNIWLGIYYYNYDRYSDGHYQWDDDTPMDYTNWDEDSPDTRARNLCVQLNMESGKWSDIKCTKKNLVLCQKTSELTLISLYGTLQNAFSRMTAKMAEQDIINEQLRVENKQMKKNMEDAIPIGFIYTQLPNQSSPIDIWPNTNWTDITEEYSGLFFRAEGKGSQPFGQIQQQNYSRISDITASGQMGKVIINDKLKNTILNLTVSEGQWNTIDIPYEALFKLSIYQTTGNNVPDNAAFRIWKRIA